MKTTRRFAAVGVLAAALALASFGATGVSANQEFDDDSGATITAPVAQQPFTYENGGTVVATNGTAPFVSPALVADSGAHDQN